MKRRQVIAVTMAVLAAVGLTACGGSTEGGTQTAVGAPKTEAVKGGEAKSGEASADGDIEPMELMAGCTYNTTSASYQYCLKFADELEAVSGGKMKINWNPASTLGNTTQHYAMLKEGTLDMFSTAFDTASTLKNSEDFNALVVPYIFDDQAHLEKFMASDLFQSMLDKVEEPNNVKFVGNICTNWPRELSTSKKPIVEPDDLKGLKIRTPESTSVVAVWKAWGANPVSISTSELYAALENGMADGQDNNVVSMYNNSYYEVQDYIMELNYIQQANVIWMSGSTWAKLNDTQKDWISQAVAAAHEVNTKSAIEEHDVDLKKVQEGGLELVEFNEAAFRAKAEEVARQLEGELFREGLYDEIRALIKE